MVDLAKQIDNTLNTIVLKSENHLELLVGHCQSQVTLTNTQEHILMLLKNSRINNSDLAKALSISQAAVTKAIKSLKKKGMLKPVKDEQDARMIYYQLTDLSRPIAEEHTQHHIKTLETYQELAGEFTKAEQTVISQFLQKLLSKIEEGES